MFLTINDKGNGLQLLNGPTILADEIRTLEGLQAIVALYAERCGAALHCSSALDFPEEYTADPVVLALCSDVRAA